MARPRYYSPQLGRFLVCVLYHEASVSVWIDPLHAVIRFINASGLHAGLVP